jgi:Flp pilus assembly protein TadG
MIGPVGHKAVEAHTRLGRLRSDVRGNTLAIMAMAMIPICALAGSGIDTARMYVVKVRLQQACDAGVLAGRKAMQANGSLDSAAATEAKTFFANNYNSGFMGTPAFSTSTNPYPFTPVQTADNQVAGTATTTVPMTIMKMFGAAAVQLTVNCQARFDVADTDVMFVLDTTGSMACTTADDPCGAAPKSYIKPDGTTGYQATEESGSKIAGLRSAVLNFYDTIAASADPSTHIRYGFVTYTSTVNAGYAVTQVDPSYMVSKWKYQTRRITNEQNLGNASSAVDTTLTNSAACTAKNNTRAPAATYAATDPFGGSYTVYPFRTDGTATKYTSSWNSSNSKCTVTSQTTTPVWTYGQYGYDTTAYVATVSGGASPDDPSKIDSSTSKWQGCIEERDTTASSSFNQSSLPKDLDPDLIPSDDTSRWRPMWPEVEYYRGGSGSATPTSYNTLNGTNPYGDYRPRQQPGDNSTDGATTSYTNLGVYAANNWAGNLSAGYVSCGKPVQRLAVLTRAQVSAYVNAADFVPQGGTYHDTGMIWGTRMISPNGIFAKDTAAWSGRNPPNRYIVFMTDGAMAPNTSIYGMYGMEAYDKRVTGSSGTGNDLDYHNARFVAECTAAKSRGITVFVVGFGQTLNSQLTSCASPGQAYYASDNASLNTAFQNIAKQVALLRISQ